MKTATEGLQDLIEEAKLRTVWWILCLFVVTYFLTHTSKSMLMNIPVALLMVCGLRILLNEVEFRWKVWDKRSTSYLSHLEKKQLTVNDSRLTTLAPPQKWKRKIGSPVVEAAIEDFINKVLNDFVVDLWYSDITSDKEAPELIHSVIMDILGEVSGRIKEVNLVELLTRDVVDLVGDHLDLFRRNQKAIGAQVMDTLSSEERDERLKHHLLASKELHPALISPECEYKVLQRLMGGLLAVVLRPREAQCPIVRCIARELLTSLVMQPIMDFASPGYINELVIHILLACNSEGFNDVATDQSSSKEHGQSSESNLKGSISSNNPGTDSCPSGNLSSSIQEDEARHPQSAEWSKVLEAATQRRTEVLMPENLENMWAIGRNYKKDLQKKPTPRRTASEITDLVSFSSLPGKDLVTEALKQETSIGTEDKASIQFPPRPQQDTQPTEYSIDVLGSRSEGHYGKVIIKEGSSIDELESARTLASHETKPKLKRSNSTSDLKVKSNLEDTFSSEGTAPIINEYYSANASTLNAHRLKSSSDVVLRSEGLRPPKLRCRVIGAYFEKLGSKSFAVYSIAVTDADNNTRFVKRRYRNFERLHRHLKDIPNYTLHLPPKRIFSSNTEDTFVHQRCIQLDKYLQDLLSIANVAEQHEVWDFLSASSKNYMFGKSSSAMTTLAVNVDEAVDDIVRQFKEVSDGIVKAVVGPSSGYEQASLVTSRNNLSWHEDDIARLPMRQCTSDSLNSFSDIEETVKDITHEHEEVVSGPQSSGGHSDNEMDPKGSRVKSQSSYIHPESNLAQKYVPQEDQIGMPPEWTPPNLSVPVLNLVDNVFQLNRRGWLRRQVFWISKQILQLVMEDAIDDWLVGQIQFLRREDIIAQGIRWVQDILWPGGIFFTKLRIQNQLNISQDDISQQTTKQSSGRKATQPGSFEQQLEAARIANDVKNLLFNGAPSTLVSLIGHKQYKRCARDIYYFLQSTICLKQLGYGILELVLISIFPELRDLVKDVHEKMHAQPI